MAGEQTIALGRKDIISSVNIENWWSKQLKCLYNRTIGKSTSKQCILKVCLLYLMLHLKN